MNKKIHMKLKADDVYNKRKLLEEAIKLKKLVIKEEFEKVENNKTVKNELLIPVNEIKVNIFRPHIHSYCFYKFLVKK
jgi:hypothetical protein